VTRVLCAGECLLELRALDAVTLKLGFAGDTYNTAVYLRRVADALGLDVEVGYLTGVGDDSHSDAMREAWRAEGIEDRAITVPGAAPGLYVVETDECGERRFSYWRSDSAARRLFGGVDWLPAIDGDALYLSGITLQLLSCEPLTALLETLDALRADGARVVLDTNYRPAGWPTRASARQAIDAVARLSDTVFASVEDEALLHGAATAQGTLDRLLALGPREVVVKDGARGAWLAAGELRVHRPAVVPARIVDTTAAGDALAGAFLAAQLAGYGPERALELALGVAAAVIGQPGALTPRGLPLISLA
jgi:2-dehydro-3-deoxygluconokinase